MRGLSDQVQNWWVSLVHNGIERICKPSADSPACCPLVSARTCTQSGVVPLSSTRGLTQRTRSSGGGCHVAATAARCVSEPFAEPKLHVYAARVRTSVSAFVCANTHTP